MIETGTILQNRYRIEKQIGQGGMGKVYVATDERFKSTVAIKETVFEDKNLRRAFGREARLLNSLKHAALPRVSDHFSEADGQFLVMEFIAGEDLAEMMEHSGEAFPLETVLNWARQLCDALEYLHAQDIIHRDIKPQNLKLTPGGQIVLLDFGLAKGNPTDAKHQSAAKSIFGFSRSYASLEQIQGAGTEPRSDLYSLSATLYHLLTGIPPADALTRAMNVLNGKPDPLIAANLINKQVSRGVAEVLSRAMALNAAERPESAISMRQMLEESDKSVDLFAAESIVEQSLTADFLTQETKIIGAKTNVSAGNQSEVKTKVAAANPSENKSYKTNVFDNDADSVKTVVGKPGDTKSPKRAKTAVAIALGGLLIGSVFSAGYFFNSNSPNGNVGNANGAETGNVIVIKTENSDVSGDDNLNSTTELTEKEVTVESHNGDSPKQPETTKTDAKSTKKQTPNSPKTGRSDQNDSDEESVVVNDESVEMGDLIIDDKGIRDKRTGKSLLPVPPEPNAPSAPPRPLTPEQMRRLELMRKRLENRKKRIIVVKTPAPQPTP